MSVMSMAFHLLPLPFNHHHSWLVLYNSAPSSPGRGKELSVECKLNGVTTNTVYFNPLFSTVNTVFIARKCIVVQAPYLALDPNKHFVE